MSYEFTLARLRDVYPELEPLFRQHYSEMVNRLALAGVEYPPYNPKLEDYFRASDGGWLVTIVLRLEGAPVGYMNIYLTNDMHNQDLIAQEDTVFVLKEHRNGIGKKLVRFGLQVLKDLGVKRFNVSAMTDLRAAKMWKRMGFKETAIQMSYTF
jgi:GNAT superfamily N-acetyltransferase